jgi:2-polyprenyl-3-methyl-5-hydroxy-6-metoxy-1,4-benzoquinol methylase
MPVSPSLAPTGTSLRRCLPELLDHLPPDAPAALASRRDLRRLNTLMGNSAWCESVVRAKVRSGERLLEIGAGDGALGRRLDRAGHRVAAIDLAPAPTDWPSDAPWHRADLGRFDRWADYPVVLGNLIFHHFDDETLRQLGRHLDEHARLIIACEPHRSAWAHTLFPLATALIAAHAVTRHDGAISIDAGFREDELAGALGLSPTRWRWRARTTFRGGYRFTAERLP